jgi:carbon storage regulator
MLILTRRPVETIYIGDEVTVTVLGVVGNQVRFGIEAPRSIVIDRAEIHERKKRAALATGGPVQGHEPGADCSPGNGPNSVVNGNVMDDEVDADTAPGRQVNGNMATLKLRR